MIALYKSTNLTVVAMIHLPPNTNWKSTTMVRIWIWKARSTNCRMSLMISNQSKFITHTHTHLLSWITLIHFDLAIVFISLLLYTHSNTSGFDCLEMTLASFFFHIFSNGMFSFQSVLRPEHCQVTFQLVKTHTHIHTKRISADLCVCVCVILTRLFFKIVCVCVCVCVCYLFHTW